MVLSFFSTYFAKTMMNNCKIRLSLMKARLKNTKRWSKLRRILEFLQKIESSEMFLSKREILRSNGRTGDNLPKRECPAKNRRVGTYGVSSTSEFPEFSGSASTNFGNFGLFFTTTFSSSSLSESSEYI